MAERRSKGLTPQGLWLYAPTLSPELEEAFEAQLSGEAPSRNQDYERYTRAPHREARWLYRHAKRLRAQIWEALWVSAERSLTGDADQRSTLRAVESLSEEGRAALLKGLWAELKFQPWGEALEGHLSDLPPMRYEVELRPASYVRLYLSPIVHLAITRVDPELGRAIGDALDGPVGGR